MTTQSASQLQDEAAEWVARIDGGVWGDADEAELQAWLAENPRRPGALLQAQAAWMTLDKPAVVAEVDGQIEADDRSGRWFARRGFLVGGGTALAASFAGGLFWLRSTTSYSTALGEVRRVPLGDGSIAAINTGSKIEIRLAEKRRDVRLDQGEAWFQVAKDPQRPFVVEAGRVRVQAVGTAFSVRRRDNGAEILVTEGVVEAWADGADGHRIRLSAGQRAFVADNAAISRTPDAPSSVDRSLAWRAGRIDLVGDPLSDAVAEFNRYNQRRLVLTNASLGTEQFDGVFRTDDPEGFAIAVKSALDVPVDLSDPAEIRIGGARR